jgi:hypothetical protein
MTRDLLVFATTVVLFAALVTIHVMLAIGLSRRAPRWHGPVALVVAPLAPWWAWRAKMRVGVALWVVAAVGYLISISLALR